MIFNTMEYVIFETGGKQYRAQKDQILEVDRLLDAEKGLVSFDKILMYVSDADIKVGKPYLSGLIVKAKVIEELKGPKVRVARFKAKSHYRKVTGFRSSLSKIQIQEISTGSSKKAK